MAANLNKLFWSIQKSNLKTAFLSKSDAFVNVLMMTVNNLSYIFMWWIIFQDKGNINGWSFGDMAIMFAIMNNSFGIFAVLFRGIEEIPKYIETGNLDNFLVSPRNILFMISTSLSTFANWGDIVTGFIMYFLSGYVSWYNTGFIIIASVYAFVLLFSFRLILSTLAFFADNTERLSHNIFLTFLTFTSQPASIFTGWYKVMFLTVIPSGFISLYPVSLIKNFNWYDFACFNFGIGFFAIFSIWFFYFGLKRYTSGNRFGIR